MEYIHTQILRETEIHVTHTLAQTVNDFRERKWQHTYSCWSRLLDCVVIEMGIRTQCVALYNRGGGNWQKNDIQVWEKQFWQKNDTQVLETAGWLEKRDKFSTHFLFIFYHPNTLYFFACFELSGLLMSQRRPRSSVDTVKGSWVQCHRTAGQKVATKRLMLWKLHEA